MQVPENITYCELCTDLPSVIACSEVKDLFWLFMSQMKEMNARTESTQPNSCTSNSDDQHCTTIKMESSATSQLRTSSKEKISSRDISILAGTSGLVTFSFLGYFSVKYVVCLYIQQEPSIN